MTLTYKNEYIKFHVELIAPVTRLLLLNSSQVHIQMNTCAAARFPFIRICHGLVVVNSSVQVP